MVAGKTAGVIGLERRRYTRHPIKSGRTGAVVNLQKPRFLNIGSPRLIALGKILDVSMGGVAVEYYGKHVQSTESDKIAILAESQEIRIADVPYKAMSDFPLHSRSNTEPVRRCGIKFGLLDDNQQRLLKCLIENCTESS